MAETVIRADVEGELIRLPDPSTGHFAKRLPMATAWHALEAADLTGAPEGVVAAVEARHQEQVYLAHYDPGLEPLDLDGLREAVHPRGPLAAWRAARVAHDLCRHLQALHECELPQLVIHPERVARCRGRFCLAPTLACVLPPLSRLPGGAHGWLHYVAPEVLRTRAARAESLYAGDVYSVGRTLQAACNPAWDPLDYVDPLTLAEHRVEWLEDGAGPGEPPPGFEGLHKLFGRMCAPLPGGRPTLGEVLTQLDRLLEALDPARAFADLLGRGELAAAERLLKDLQRSQEAGVFGCPARTVYLLSADFALAQTPPQCQRAVTYLQAVEAKGHPEADVRRRMGRAYALWAAQPGHLTLACESYLAAASLSGWRGDILDELAGLLRPADDPDFALDATESVPFSARTRRLITARAEAWLRAGRPERAWEEVARAFYYRPFDPELYGLARSIAARLEPIFLMRWMQPFREEPGYAAPVSLAWERNGTAAYAEQYYKKALAYQP